MSHATGWSGFGKRSQGATATGLDLIAAERKRQIEGERWSSEHDDEHESGELATAAACYALPSGKRQIQCHTVPVCGDSSFPPGQTKVHGTEHPRLWPWDCRWWKPTPNDRIRELVKAGALIAAEIDRLQRKAST